MVIEKEILAYLARNPDAEDAVEGIARWWLSAHRAYGIMEVQSALDKLVSRSLLIARRCPKGLTYYRAAR